MAQRDTAQRNNATQNHTMTWHCMTWHQASHHITYTTVHHIYPLAAAAVSKHVRAGSRGRIAAETPTERGRQASMPMGTGPFRGRRGPPPGTAWGLQRRACPNPERRGGAPSPTTHVTRNETNRGRIHFIVAFSVFWFCFRDRRK